MIDGNSFLRNSVGKANTTNQTHIQQSFGYNFNNMNIQQQHLSDEVLAEIKSNIKKMLSEIYSTQMITNKDDPAFKDTIRNTIVRQLQEEKRVTSIDERNRIVKIIIDDIFGLGVLQTLLDDPSITEIMVSRYDLIFIEERGRMKQTSIRFSTDDELREVIGRICAPIGRTINESKPVVDARLPDGSRVNATVPPVSPDGCTLTIRKFPNYRLKGEDYLDFGSLNEDMLKFLDACVKARLNIFVLGGTGTGKTTFLNMLSNYIPSDLSIVTVEDSCELQLNQINVRRLEAKSANSEGVGAVEIRDLIKNTLRMLF